jgi:hypothetical protein
MTSPAGALRPGEKLASTTCTTKVVVIRAPAGRRPLIACGGSPMVPADSAAQQPSGEVPGAADAGTAIGKRYVDPEQTVELLCISSGSGELTCEGAPMNVKAAKPLPASD